MEYKYQIFGSESSADLDVCFFIDELSTIDDNHKMVQHCIDNSDLVSRKKVNANLAILTDGKVSQCFKGDKDELNNALFTTYDLHRQRFGKQIRLLVDRDLELRIVRCLRSVVSYFSRTRLREEAKKALKGSVRQKIDFLSKVNLIEFSDFGKNGTKIEVYKTIAFQLGMTLALIDGIELYTKESIIDQYPKLEDYLMRRPSESDILEAFIQQLVSKLNLIVMKPRLEHIANFPYLYYQYGSISSTDVDVIVVLPKEEMPEVQEDRKRKMKQLMTDFQLDWNAIFVVVENGVIVDTVYTKSWVDSLNNAFLTTYKNHVQLFEIPITKKLKRNKTLAIYKAIRTVLSMLTRTGLRSEIKPILKGIHPFEKKIEALQYVDFSLIDTFNQKNVCDVDIWKIIAFYIAQNELLIAKNIEVYSKEAVVEHFPELSSFIYRVELTMADKEVLTHLKNDWLTTVINYGEFISEKEVLSCHNERINMVKEISI